MTNETQVDAVEAARWQVDRALAEAWNAGKRGLEREAIWASFDRHLERYEERAA